VRNKIVLERLDRLEAEIRAFRDYFITACERGDAIAQQIRIAHEMTNPPAGGFDQAIAPDQDETIAGEFMTLENENEA